VALAEATAEYRRGFLGDFMEALWPHEA
jgi:hypothetical protein